MNTEADIAASEKSKTRKSFLFLRGIGIFLLFALLLGGLHRLCLHYSEQSESETETETVEAAT